MAPGLSNRKLATVSGIDLSIGHSHCLPSPAPATVRLGVEVQVEVQLLALGGSLIMRI